MSAPNRFGNNLTKARIAMLIGADGQPHGGDAPSSAEIIVNGQPVSDTNPFPVALAGAPTWVTPPATSGASGTAGQMAYNGFYLFVCVATNTWRRVALGSW